jgi:hypothetical protein
MVTLFVGLRQESWKVQLGVPGSFPWFYLPFLAWKEVALQYHVCIIIYFLSSTILIY